MIASRKLQLLKFHSTTCLVLLCNPISYLWIKNLQWQYNTVALFITGFHKREVFVDRFQIGRKCRGVFRKGHTFQTSPSKLCFFDPSHPHRPCRIPSKFIEPLPLRDVEYIDPLPPHPARPPPKKLTKIKGFLLESKKQRRSYFN